MALFGDKLVDEGDGLEEEFDCDGFKETIGEYKRISFSTYKRINIILTSILIMSC